MFQFDRSKSNQISPYNMSDIIWSNDDNFKNCIFTIKIFQEIGSDPWSNGDIEEIVDFCNQNLSDLYGLNKNNSWFFKNESDMLMFSLRFG